MDKFRRGYPPFNSNFQMINSINTEHLPLKDLISSGFIILIMSTIIANIYNPLWGVTYALGNTLTLSFLSWLYQETWNTHNNKNRK